MRVQACGREAAILQSAETSIGTHPQHTVAVFEQTAHNVVDQTLSGRVAREAPLLQSREAAEGPDPDSPVPGAEHGKDEVVG
jgi:hypothetical protein